MNTTETLQQMQQLRLQGMYRAYHSQLELPMDQQFQILETAFNEWKGTREQTDDVLVMGIKLS